jgi:hypothetical protein
MAWLAIDSNRQAGLRSTLEKFQTNSRCSLPPQTRPARAQSDLPPHPEEHRESDASRRMAASARVAAKPLRGDEIGATRRANATGARSVVQPLLQKYSDFQKWQISLYPWPSRFHKRGASRSSRTLDAGCDGRKALRAILARTNGADRTAKSCGPDASTLVSSWRIQFADDGDKRARSPGKARNKPLKPLRGECRAFPV